MEDSPQTWRARIRSGEYSGPTTGCAPGFAQANLLVVPSNVADAFEEFCKKNQRPCPLLERLHPGLYLTRLVADEADIRTDLPRYHVFQGGHLVADTDRVVGPGHDWWSSDLVGFILGCSFTFEWALLEEDVPLFHQQQKKNVSMYKTNIKLRPVGAFQGTMVVSMRYIPMSMVEKVTRITARFPKMHGHPIHVGDPRAIGIKDLERPQFGDIVERPPNTMPVFWACGVTSQVVALQATPGTVICHAPGHMLILDKHNDDYDDEVAKRT